MYIKKLKNRKVRKRWKWKEYSNENKNSFILNKKETNKKNGQDKKKVFLNFIIIIKKLMFY